MSTPADPAPRRGCACLPAIITGAFILAVTIFAAPRPTPEMRSPSPAVATLQSIMSQERTGAPPSVPVTSGAPTSLPPATPSQVVGIASWYCNTDPARGPLSSCYNGITDGPFTDSFAAAGPLLRIGDWRGREVLVSGPAGFTLVELIDTCECLVDLYADAFELVCGPLSRGVCEVKVTW